VPYALEQFAVAASQRRTTIALSDLDTGVQEHGGLGEIGEPDLRSAKPVAADFQFFIHRALPDDETGHGAASFRFPVSRILDAKAFQNLTGKDAAVIEYLNQEKSVISFSPV